MHTADTTTGLNDLAIEDDDAVLIDTSDPSTYTVCETAADIATALGTCGESLMLPGETIASGAPPRCEDCDTMPKLDVYRSGAGFYIGTYCQCGPYTRESGYYRTRELA